MEQASTPRVEHSRGLGGRVPQWPVSTPPLPFYLVSGAIEVACMDVDALLNDAGATLLTSQPSVLLQAIEAGTMIAVMSEQAYWEIGWMSAPSARSQGIEDEDLRRLITAEYLPRIPVVSTGTSLDDTSGADLTQVDGERVGATDHWLPSVFDVRDPKDVAHVQVAQLVTATVVYSHDRHLRTPGHAPRTRPEFDVRVQHLGVITSQRQHEARAAQFVALIGQATNHILKRSASLARVKNGTAWAIFGLATAATTYWAFADAPRREKLAKLFGPFAASLEDAYAREAVARGALHSARLLSPVEPDRLEVQVASYLVRRPDSTMSDIVDGLGLDAVTGRELSIMLRAHPSFEKVSRWGWRVGRCRRVLETESSTTWQPHQ